MIGWFWDKAQTLFFYDYWLIILISQLCNVRRVEVQILIDWSLFVIIDWLVISDFSFVLRCPMSWRRRSWGASRRTSSTWWPARWSAWTGHCPTIDRPSEWIWILIDWLIVIYWSDRWSIDWVVVTFDICTISDWPGELSIDVWFIDLIDRWSICWLIVTIARSVIDWFFGELWSISISIFKNFNWSVHSCALQVQGERGSVQGCRSAQDEHYHWWVISCYWLIDWLVFYQFDVRRILALCQFFFLLSSNVYARL